MNDLRNESIHLMLNLSTVCNLACRYCIVDAGRAYGAQEQLMSQDTGHTTIDWLFDTFPSSSRYLIGFLGGEPFLNFSTMQSVMKYAIERGNKSGISIEFTAITNGTRINEERISFLRQYPFHLVFSMDGPLTIHDSLRITARGKGTHHMVVKAFEKALGCQSSTFSVGVSCTLTKGTDSDAILQYFRNFEVGSLKMEWVRISNDSALYPDSTDISRYRDTLLHRAEWFTSCMESTGRSPDYTFRNIVARYATNNTHNHHCAAAQSIFGISTIGDIYPCSYFSGDDNYIIGSVRTGLSEDRVKAYLMQTSVMEYEDCRTCAVRNICSGGCPVARRYTGKIDCALTQLEVEAGQKTFEKLIKNDPFCIMAIGNRAAAEELRNGLVQLQLGGCQDDGR